MSKKPKHKFRKPPPKAAAQMAPAQMNAAPEADSTAPSPVPQTSTGPAAMPSGMSPGQRMAGRYGGAPPATDNGGM